MIDLLLLGGGHSHLEVLRQGAKFRAAGGRVILVSMDRFQYYSGMGAGYMGGIYSQEAIRFDLAAMASSAGFRFIQGEVSLIKPQLHQVELTDGTILTYDLLSCNLGSSIAFDNIPSGSARLMNKNVFTIKPIANLVGARQAIRKALAERDVRCVVVGGGASACELAGALWRIAAASDLHNHLQIELVSRAELLSYRRPRLRRLARRSLERRGVKIITHQKAIAIKAASRAIASRVDTVLHNGERLRSDFVFVACGIAPPPIFARSGMKVAPDGGMLVNKYLQAIDFPEIFGVGDCIEFTPRHLDRVGVYAVRQASILTHNLLIYLEASAERALPNLRRFKPQRNYLFAINLGDGTAVASKWGLTIGGTPAFAIKDKFDRDFMIKYHAQQAEHLPTDAVVTPR